VPVRWPHSGNLYLPHCGEILWNLHIMLSILAIMYLTSMILIASGIIVIRRWLESSICKADVYCWYIVSLYFPVSSSNLNNHSMHSNRPFKWKHKRLRARDSNKTILSLYMQVYTVLDLFKYQSNGLKISPTKTIASNEINMLCHVHVLKIITVKC